MILNNFLAFWTVRKDRLGLVPIRIGTFRDFSQSGLGEPVDAGCGMQAETRPGTFRDFSQSMRERVDAGCGVESVLA